MSMSYRIFSYAVLDIPFLESLCFLYVFIATIYTMIWKHFFTCVFLLYEERNHVLFTFLWLTPGTVPGGQKMFVLLILNR